MFWNMEIFESPCFNTWRFKNLCGLNMEIFESSCFNTRRFKNLHVLKHGGFVRQNCSNFPISMFQYTEIQKSPCIKHRNFWILVFQYTEIKKFPCIKHRNFWNFEFQYTEIQKFPCIETWRFKNFRVLHTHIFFKRPITQWNRNRWRKFLGCESGDWVVPVYEKKQSSKIACYCPYKIV